MNKETYLGELTVDGERYSFEKTGYAVDDSIAIICNSLDKEYNFWEPYCNITVNLSGYGMTPNENEIFIDHKVINSPIFESFFEAFCDKSFAPEPISYGYVTSKKVRLKSDL